ncbi:MAG: ornithine racemase [Candidatus Atribacteria bacterium]|jgi:predicted amino acid racemase|uniref:alanine racemase n=1 Tax=Atrimonas thermophila TaxID=3064161 RepID=UPI0024AB9B3F|nr:ornithine racemase [Candidatus Atribacteria bacterium]
MMHYPLLRINTQAIRYNIRAILQKLNQWQLRAVAITKGFCADLPLVKLFLEEGITCFGDSNPGNLLKIKHAFSSRNSDLQLYLIRLPMSSEIRLIVDNNIVPFVSNFESLQLLNHAAYKVGKFQKVILAVEGGDAREGFLEEEILGDFNFKALKHIDIVGLGATLACLSGVLPDLDVVARLVALKKQLEKKLDKELTLSVGGTTFLELWEGESLPRGVDEIRMGEAFLFGHDISRKKAFPWLNQDAFEVVAEIVEVKRKQPLWGKARGFDAFGKTSAFSLSREEKERALVAIGKQDVDENQLYPEDKNVTIIGATSNYLVLDVSKSSQNYKPGDTLSFRAGYGAVLRAFLSPYVSRIYF